MQADPQILTEHEQWNEYPLAAVAEKSRTRNEAAEVLEVCAIELHPYMESVRGAGLVQVPAAEVACQ